jgi:hypothetical protein
VKRFVSHLLLAGALLVGCGGSTDEQAAAPFAAQLATPEGLIVIISLSPGSVGANEVHIFLTPPGGSLAPVLALTAQATLGGDSSAASATSEIIEEGPNHFQGTVSFPRRGQWELQLVVQVSTEQQAVLRTTVPIP